MNIESFKGKIVKNIIKTTKLDANKKIKLIVLADLHEYTNDACLSSNLVNTIKIIKPDIIMIAGDIFNDSKKWLEEKTLNSFREFLKELASISIVCLTLGNHDIKKINDKNKETILNSFYNLKNLSKNIYPLYNDSIKLDNIEIIGYVPRANLMNNYGLKTQIHGLAHDEFICDYENEGVKFNSNKNYNIYLGHDPHLIGSSENGVVLKSLSICDLFITGHLHNGYKLIFELLGKPNAKSVSLDMGWTEQPTGIVDAKGKQINRLWPPIFGKSNLCRGIVYLNSDAEQKVLEVYNNFYVNDASEPNIQNWRLVKEEEAREMSLENNLHPMLVSEGVNPIFRPKEKYCTINYIEIISDKN